MQKCFYSHSLHAQNVEVFRFLSLRQTLSNVKDFARISFNFSATSNLLFSLPLSWCFPWAANFQALPFDDENAVFRLLTRSIKTFEHALHVPKMDKDFDQDEWITCLQKYTWTICTRHSVQKDKYMSWFCCSVWEHIDKQKKKKKEVSRWRNIQNLLLVNGEL